MTQDEARKIIENPADHTIFTVAQALARNNGGEITGLLMINVSERATVPVMVRIGAIGDVDELAQLIEMLEGGDDGDEDGTFVARPAEA